MEKKKKMAKEFWIGVSLVLGACVLNNVFLENLIIGDRASGQLLTLLQFVFIAAMSVWGRFERVENNLLDGVSARGKFSFFGFWAKKTASPVWWYLVLTAIFWSLSVMNNMAYNYDISQPLHMVFRSSSLAVSFLLGYLMFGKTYNVAETVGVIVVTVGIFLTTYADSAAASSSFFSFQCGSQGCLSSLIQSTRWFFSDFLVASGSRKLVGVALLTAALFLSGLLGHLQSWGYGYWKKRDENEAMFFQHFLSIFFFFPLTSTLAEHAALWSESPVFVELPGGVSMTWMWFNVWGNLITQYVCIRGVYLLIATSGPVTTTMVLTVRKFLSLIVSIVFFGNVWTSAHWVGTLLVFGGAFIYGAGPQVLQKIKQKQV